MADSNISEEKKKINPVRGATAKKLTGTFGDPSLNLTQQELINEPHQIFAPTLANIAVEDCGETTLHPINNALEPFEFRMLGIPDQYIIPWSLYVTLECRIVNADDSNLAPDNNDVGFVDALGQAIFSKIECEIDNQFNTVLTTSHASYLGFLSYIRSIDTEKANWCEMIRALPDDLNNLQVQSVPDPKIPDADVGKAGDPYAVTKDDRGTMRYIKTLKSSIRQNQLKNPNFLKRAKCAAESAWFPVLCYPEIDLFKTPVYLPPGKGITLRFHIAPSNFLIITQALPFKDYKLEIRGPKLTFRTTKLHRSIIDDHIGLWNIKKYSKNQFKRRQVYLHTIQKGTTNIELPSIINGALPKTMLIGFVSTKAMNGDFRLNPFYFDHCHITSLEIRVNGELIRQKSLMNLNFEKFQYMEAYLNYFRNSGIVGLVNQGLPNISYKAFGAGKRLLLRTLITSLIN